MAKQTIDLGSAPNDGTGSTLRAGGLMINENFDEIYASFMSVSDGVTLLNADGTTLSGSLSLGSITTVTVSSGTGFPSASGQAFTFNGFTLDRSLSIFVTRATSRYYMQAYDAVGAGLGWEEITAT